MANSKNDVLSAFTTEEVIERQKLFKCRFMTKFLSKHQIYRNILKEYGINVTHDISDYSVNFDKSFEDEIEIVVSENRGGFLRSCSKANRYSIGGLFRQVYHAVRKTKSSRIMHKLQDVTDDDLKETLEAVSAELVVAFEYQIVMLKDGNDVLKMAEYAVLCIFSYLNSKDSCFQASSILQSVLEISTKQSYPRDQIVKTRITKTDSIRRNYSKRWKIKDIFKQPGIRLKCDQSESPCNDDVIEYKYFGCFTPFGCICRPEKYGFRTPIHVWDDETREYRMLDNDRISCHQSHEREIPFSELNIHQQYKPKTFCAHDREFSNIRQKSTPEVTNSEEVLLSCNVNPNL